MKYAYFPGCSLMESAKEYDFSTKVVMELLDGKLREIPDWGCCGATAVESVSRDLALSLAARNLAIAEKVLPGIDVLAPCSACYLNLRRVQEELPKDRELMQLVNKILSVEDLAYYGSVSVRHLLDVLENDIGYERLGAHVQRDLSNLTVAPYTGCQVLRPYRVFDDPERPQVLAKILKTMGVNVHPWGHSSRCCGASLLANHRAVGLEAVRSILEAAQGADCIVTVCPMCQMNLELYQGTLGLRIPVLYLPQLMGIAYGFSSDFMRLDENLSIPSTFLESMTPGVHSENFNNRPEGR
ncbi:CoB--CoM heterodisulfide reductase iron-sulfur subunit B family protein [Desulfocurvibacter africanus]|uniref:CoB--CoM heterodisulfide reductase n=1 Tax=Desulfocurvibacter africanus subsp. africanus str. Walvis Bay TaxID=690850 RepID=F3Z2F2_DESAF|nr:CoB--CoM heterodisulfide reductase iron-sulfur subunit B family protein [Desulfocurvibacter africanus]EGJ50192.1 CoB--CoM heterodisulfide reductase [Desulfocurvibacter africanus subsp. africanus str. Walvis Bay]